MKHAYTRVSTRKNFVTVTVSTNKSPNLTLKVMTNSLSKSFPALLPNVRALILIQRLQKGDTLIVTKLDRLARSTAEGSKLINDLLRRGVAVHILDMGLVLLNNTPNSKLITHILLAFAEYERDLIIERTQAGKEIARSKDGFREGRLPIDRSAKILPPTLSSTRTKPIAKLSN